MWHAFGSGVSGSMDRGGAATRTACDAVLKLVFPVFGSITIQVGLLAALLRLLHLKFLFVCFVCLVSSCMHKVAA